MAAAAAFFKIRSSKAHKSSYCPAGSVTRHRPRPRPGVRGAAPTLALANRSGTSRCAEEARMRGQRRRGSGQRATGGGRRRRSFAGHGGTASQAAARP